MRRRPGQAGGLLVVLTLLLLTVAPSPAEAGSYLPRDGRWPLTGPVRVVRGFDPPGTPWGAGHRGVDLAAYAGDPVVAAAAGKVTFARRLAGRGVVVVDHGSVRTTYEPVTASVGVGTRVRAGDVLGVLSGGGHCGPRSCLHWGLLRGDVYLNPLLLARGEVTLRLLPGDARALAAHRAATRAAAARVAAVAVRASLLAQAAAGAAPAGHHGFLRPVPGRVTSAFGRRLHPVLHVWKLHDGTDLGAPCGTPIRAAFAGRVTRRLASPAYGNRLFLSHGTVDGRRVRTGYNHAARYVVGVGSRVRRGQVIGYVGSTGLATGCHLHLMVWLDGRLSDPMSWL